MWSDKLQGTLYLKQQKYILHNNNSNEKIQVDNGEISYHIVEMQPSNQNFLSRTSVIGRAVDDLKFDISAFNQA